MVAVAGQLLYLDLFNRWGWDRPERWLQALTVPSLGVLSLGLLEPWMLNWWVFVALGLVVGAAMYLSAEMDGRWQAARAKPGQAFVRDVAVIVCLAAAMVGLALSVSDLRLRLLGCALAGLLAAYRTLRFDYPPLPALAGSAAVAAVAALAGWAAMTHVLEYGAGFSGTVVVVVWYAALGWGRQALGHSTDRHLLVESAAFSALGLYLVWLLIGIP